MGPFHLRVALTAGAEGAWRQENEDSDSVEDRWIMLLALPITHGLK